MTDGNAPVFSSYPVTDTPFGYLMEKAGINNGYYFITPAEFEHVEDRFKSHLKPVYEGPVAVAQTEKVPDPTGYWRELYYDLLKRADVLKDRLTDAHRIIAEYKAGTTAGAKADVAAHGMPGARGQGWPASLPPKREIQKLIEDFIAPDLDTERAFATHRRSWLVQCLQALLTAYSLPSTEGK